MVNYRHLIIEARESVGLTQAELARLAGIPRSTMNVYERGKRTPSAEMLVRILHAAGFELTLTPIESPVDPNVAGQRLEEVLDLAEALPFTPRTTNDFPPLIDRLSQEG